MLWYKAWRESRIRFVLSALTITGLCLLFVVFQNDTRANMDSEPLSYVGYIWRITYKGYIRELFVLLTLFLGVGGLLRERAYGTASFTLALPVSRWKLVVARAMIGFSEVAILAFLPALLIPLLSPLVHESYPWSQALEFGLLWTAGGALVFAMGFLASVVLGGEFSAPVVAFAILLGYSGIVDLPGMDSFDIHDIMSGTGTPNFRSDTFLLAGPLPWLSITVITLIALSLVAVAVQITQRQDF